MGKTIICTGQAPAPVGPYSQAVRYGNLIFISGQISADVKTGEVIRQSVGDQTRAAMDIIRNVLQEQGAGMDSILKCTVHLSDAGCFSEMNKAYQTYFKEGEYPARLCVSGVQLYDGVDVEIDAVAGLEK